MSTVLEPCLLSVCFLDILLSLFSDYWAEILTATPPISWLSERYNSRRYPLLCGLVALIGSIILFMEAPNYAVMVVARVLQGISSSTIWIVGLALLWVFPIDRLVKTELNIECQLRHCPREASRPYVLMNLYILLPGSRVSDISSQNNWDSPLWDSLSGMGSDWLALNILLTTH